MKKYYTGKEVEEGITDENGREIIPPIKRKTLGYLRSKRKLKYVKVAGGCMYTLEWLQEYLNNNIVETVA